MGISPGQRLEEMLTECEEQPEQFTGISCLLITWKSNPEVEQFKVKQKQPRKTAAVETDGQINVRYHHLSKASLSMRWQGRTVKR